MKSLLLILSMILSVNSFADYRCIDEAPKTDEARRQLIRKTTIELQTAKDMEKIYEELADDSKTRRDFAIALAAFSTAPFAVAGTLCIGSAEAAAIDVIITALIPFFGELALGTTFLVKGASTAWSQNIDQGKVKKIKKQFEKSAASECSYKKSIAALDQAREKVLEEEFNGSTSNMILDHVLLGQVSKAASTKLYAYAALKRILLEKKLADLDALGRM